MSLNTEVSAAFTEAQNVFVEMLGTTTGNNNGTFTLSDRTGTFEGTFNEFDAQDPLDVSGIKVVRLLTIIATRDQFDTAPSSAPRTTVTAKGKTWSLQSTTEMPFHYRLTCRVLT